MKNGNDFFYITKNEISLKQVLIFFHFAVLEIFLKIVEFSLVKLLKFTQLIFLFSRGICCTSPWQKYFSDFLRNFLRLSQKLLQNFSEFLQTFSQIFCRFWDIDEKVGDFSEALIFYSFSELLPNFFFKFSAFSSSLFRFSRIFK